MFATKPARLGQLFCALKECYLLYEHARSLKDSLAPTHSRVDQESCHQRAANRRKIWWESMPPRRPRTFLFAIREINQLKRQDDVIHAIFSSRFCSTPFFFAFLPVKQFFFQGCFERRIVPKIHETKTFTLTAYSHILNNGWATRWVCWRRVAPSVFRNYASWWRYVVWLDEQVVYQFESELLRFSIGTPLHFVKPACSGLRTWIFPKCRRRDSRTKTRPSNWSSRRRGTPENAGRSIVCLR